MATDSPTLHRSLSARPGALRDLMDHAERYASLTQVLRQRIQEPWIDDVRLVNMRGDTAILFVSSAAALVLLRFRQQILLNLLRDQLHMPCSKIEAKVRSPSRHPLNTG